MGNSNTEDTNSKTYPFRTKYINEDTYAGIGRLYDHSNDQVQ